MTSPYLPNDCIYYILKYLKDCQSTLFNCLLVNRFWCRAAIPLLYANPLVESNNKVIFTFILCFSKEEILQLKNQLSLIGIKNINDSIDDEYKPLFEYPKYLKIYDYYIVNLMTFKWIRNLSINVYRQYPDEKSIYEICPIYHRSILNHSINIENLQFSIDLFIKTKIDFNIPVTNLTKLSTLSFQLHTFEDKIQNEFLNNISIHCLNLKELEISTTEYSSVSSWKTHAATLIEKFCIIIQKQHNLEEFKISQSEYLLNDIFLSLEFQKYSLVSIEFLNIEFRDISFKNFINLYNLKYLKFVDCNDMEPNDRYEILQFASFKLKELKFETNTWNENIEPTIIKYLGTSLQSLSINDKVTTVSIIKNISLYCLNLITLELVMFDFQNILVFPYFKKLEIRELIICVDRIFGYSMNEMVMNLANNLTINVKEISFIFGFHNNYIQIYFNTFLENCHGYLEKINLGNKLIGSEFFKIILNYIEKSSNNSLKILNLDRTVRVLNEKELTLLDEIRAKGVKIVANFDSTRYSCI
jgi:hypothetical protein